MPEFMWIILGVLGGAVALWYLVFLVALIYVAFHKD